MLSLVVSCVPIIAGIIQFKTGFENWLILWTARNIS